MKRLGRRKLSPPPKNLNTGQTSVIRPVAFILLIVVTTLLVLSTLPNSTDYGQYVTHQNTGQEERVVKGIVVSHGFLKISVNVAYKAKDPLPNSAEVPAEMKPAAMDFSLSNKTVAGPLASETLDSRNVSQSIGLDKEELHEDRPTVEPNTAAPSEPSSERIEPLASSSLIPPPPPPIEPPPQPALDPSKVIPKSKDDIIVDVLFHRISAPNKDSLLSCRLSEADIYKAIDDASRVWKRQAKILLRFSNSSLDWEKASKEVETSFSEHLERFPKNDDSGQPWTTENPGRIGLVANDLIQILAPEDQTQWSKINPIHVYCIGAFVGYNGVTWNRQVFIRSLKYHRTDVEMDVDTFSRILAHEIGHVLNLQHPSMEICSLPCEQMSCQLMCQQRWLPSTIDVRFARALTSIQVARARTAAALLDVFNQFSVVPKNNSIKLFGIGTEHTPNTRTSKAPLIWIAQPLSMKETVMVTGISFLPSKLKSSCTLGLVSGKAQHPEAKDGTISTKTRALGSLQNTVSVRSGLSRLVFNEIDLGWWTGSRHLEAIVDPPVKVFQGHYVGLAFSCTGAGLQLQKRQGNELLQVTKVPSSLFSTSKGASMDVRADRVSGVSAIFGVVGTVIRDG